MEQPPTKDQKKRPVRPPNWVFDPVSGKEIDVAAFLEALNEFDTIYDAPDMAGAGGVAVIRSLIRTLNLTEVSSFAETPGKRVDTYADLHRLEDMFEATRCRPPSQ